MIVWVGRRRDVQDGIWNSTRYRGKTPRLFAILTVFQNSFHKGPTYKRKASPWCESSRVAEHVLPVYSNMRKSE